MSIGLILTFIDLVSVQGEWYGKVGKFILTHVGGNGLDVEEK